MSTFAITNFPWPTGVLLRARFSDNVAATVTDLALAENTPGRYSGTVTLVTTAPSFTVEIRQVATQDAAGFDAGTNAYGPADFVPSDDVVPGGGGIVAGQTTFAYTIGGTETITSVVLQAPAAVGNFGVRNYQTQTLVISAGTPMVLVGSRTYQYGPITDAASGLIYEWYPLVTFASGAFINPQVVTNGSTVANAAGVYATLANLQDRFGPENVAAWSDLSNYGTLDTARVQRALDYADDAINTYFRNGWYTLPLTVSRTVTDWAVSIAGHWLWENRGQRDEGKDDNRYGVMLKSTMRHMGKVRAGVEWLDSARATGPTGTLPTGPVDVVV